MALDLWNTRLGDPESGDLLQLFKLLEKGVDVNADAGKLLSLASREGHFDCIQALLAANADPDLRVDSKDHDIPLYEAASNGHTACVLALLTGKADVNTPTSCGGTALFGAACSGHQACVQALLMARADVTAKSMHGETAMQVAVKNAEANHGSGIRCVSELLSYCYLNDVHSTLVRDTLSSDFIAFSICNEGTDVAELAGTMLQDCPDGKGGKAPAAGCVPGRMMTFRGPLRDDSSSFIHRDFAAWNMDGEYPEDVQGLIRSCCNVVFQVPKVRAHLRFLYGSTVGTMCSTVVMEAIARTKNWEVLATDLIELAVTEAWKSVHVFVYADTVLNIGAAISAVYAAQDVRQELGVNFGSFSVLVGLNTKQIVEEVCCTLHTVGRWLQWWQRFRQVHGMPIWLRAISHIPLILFTFVWHTLKHPGTILYIVFSLQGISILRSAGSPMQRFEYSLTQRWWLGTWFALIWLRILYGLCVTNLIGPRLLPIVRTTIQTVPFFCLVAFMIAAATHVHYTLERHSNPSPFYSSLITVFRLGVLGDFDLVEWEGVDSVDGGGSILEPSTSLTIVHAICYAVALTFSIILMSSLIGILSQAYEVEEHRTGRFFLQARASMIAKYHTYPWVMCSEHCCRGDRDQCLYALVREDHKPEPLRSLRSLLKDQEQRYNQKITDIGAKVDTISATLNALINPSPPSSTKGRKLR